MKKLFLLFVCTILIGQLFSQTPQKDLGIKENEMEYLTLSDGRYDEYHGYKDFERVGSVIIDMRTKKIVRFINKDSIPDDSMFELDMTTRFLTIDPLAEKYTQMSPYGYCANNPLIFIDPDGREIVFNGQAAGSNNKEEQAYNNYKNDVNNRKNAAQAKVDANKDKGFFGKLFSGYYSAKSDLNTFSGISNELTTMETTKDAVFNIKLGENTKGTGAFGYNTNSGNFDVRIKTTDIAKAEGSLSHELKHGYQYLAGEIDFDSKGNRGELYGVEDEQVAWQRRQAIDGTSYTSEEISASYANSSNPVPAYGGSLKAMSPNERIKYYQRAKAEGKVYNANWANY